MALENPTRIRRSCGPRLLALGRLAFAGLFCLVTPACGGSEGSGADSAPAATGVPPLSSSTGRGSGTGGRVTDSTASESADPASSSTSGALEGTDASSGIGRSLDVPGNGCEPLGEGCPQERIPIVLDTDANHGVDDQNAIAFIVFRQDVFDIRAMVSNSTPGTSIGGMHDELEDIVAVCGAAGQFPLGRGPEQGNNFEQLRDQVGNDDFDGKAAVELIVQAANNVVEGKLRLVSIGKVTNTALALEMDPEIAGKISFHMMGTGFPHSMGLGGPNEADAEALRQIFDSGMEIHITPGAGNAANILLASHEQMRDLEGFGVVVDPPVLVRSRDASFDQFGDWVLHRWNNGDVPDPKQIWDLGALIPLVDPGLATPTDYGAPDVSGGELVPRPDNENRVTVWDDFDAEASIAQLLDAVRTPRRAI